MVQQFHDSVYAIVQNDGEYFQHFPVGNGVKQGCVVAPTPRLQAKTKVHEAIASDFLFADDCALNASTQADMQRSIDLFTRACDDFGLTISTNKTEVLHQPAPSTVTLSRSINIDEEVTFRIAKASTAFGRLKQKVWKGRGLRLDTSLKVYRAAILPSLFYACETRTVYTRHIAFHVRCHKTWLRVKWQDNVSDTEVLQRAKMESIHAILMCPQLRRAGHVHRMDYGRFPKRLLYG
ncbi:uncharacterized protein LOC143027826 [Oratosquilla oratoria]|uniref:uncharacterized protein LOC143027826 n=1 Tax=Oratosquilla oratoria TaxID=337810 RepID=UPI003F75F114